MEFTKLSEVAVVETANDTDKVLIEQDGEIKRVPKTEVGGSGGNTLIINASEDGSTFTANMTLTEALAALNNRELAGAALYMVQQGMTMCSTTMMFGDMSSQLGTEAMAIACMEPELQLYWTASGFSPEPPA